MLNTMNTRFTQVVAVGDGAQPAQDQLIASGVFASHCMAIERHPSHLTQSLAATRIVASCLLPRRRCILHPRPVSAEVAATELEQVRHQLADAAAIVLMAILGSACAGDRVSMIATVARTCAPTSAVVVMPFAIQGRRDRQAAADELEAVRNCIVDVTVIEAQTYWDNAAPGATLGDVWANVYRAMSDVVRAAIFPCRMSS